MSASWLIKNSQLVKRLEADNRRLRADLGTIGFVARRGLNDHKETEALREINDLSVAGDGLCF